MQVILIVLLVGGMGFFAYGVIETFRHSAARREGATVNARLNQIKQRTETPLERELAGRGRGGENISLSEREELARAPRKADLLPMLTRYLSRQAVFARLEEDLLQARSNWRASELLFASAALGLIVFLILVFFIKILIVALLFGGFALLLPWWYVRMLKGRWLRAFENQLADTLLLMANGLKSGYSFMQAVEMVAREAQPPMSDEFKRVSDEIQVGRSIEDALDDMARRVQSPDFELVVTAVLIQREVGGALAEILDTIARTIRERVKIKGEIRTLTTQGRISGFFLALMPIGLGFAINIITKLLAPDQPSYMLPLIQEKAGHYMIAIGLVMQIIGFLVIRKIVTIEV